MPTTRILDEEGHPLIGELLRRIRDRELQKDRLSFRTALRQLACFLGYEIARDLPRAEIEIQTPLGQRTEPVLARPPVLATVLRAGLPCLEGLQEVFPTADTIVLGAMRKEEAQLEKGSLDLAIDFGYAALSSLEGRTLIYVDAMIATGSTLRAVHPLVCERAGTPARVVVAGAIAYRGALQRLQDELNADLVIASADGVLNEKGYIVPGLGDAGDLAFGVKL